MYGNGSRSALRKTVIGKIKVTPVHFLLLYRLKKVSLSLRYFYFCAVEIVTNTDFARWHFATTLIVYQPTQRMFSRQSLSKMSFTM